VVAEVVVADVVDAGVVATAVVVAAVVVATFVEPPHAVRKSGAATAIVQTLTGSNVGRLD